MAESLKDGSLDDVRQIVGELHIFRNSESEDYIGHLKLLRELYKLGFRTFFFRMWNVRPIQITVYRNDEGIARTRFHEVHFMRTLT